MIVDSSILPAVNLNEPGVASALVNASRLRMSAGDWLEAAMFVDPRKNPHAKAQFEDLVWGLGVELVSVTGKAARRSRITHADYGRGSHPAKLNLGDCFAYALAKLKGKPLLTIRNDFSRRTSSRH